MGSTVDFRIPMQEWPEHTPGIALVMYNCAGPAKKYTKASLPGKHLGAFGRVGESQASLLVQLSNCYCEWDE